jgi:chromatin remodeling complex protein RSC6
MNQYINDFEGEECDKQGIQDTAVAMVKISDKVAEFIGCPSDENIMNRSDVFNTVWKYISDKNLKSDESEKNNISCDEKLEVLFQRKKLSSEKLTKLLEKVR